MKKMKRKKEKGRRTMKTRRRMRMKLRSDLHGTLSILLSLFGVSVPKGGR
jgi:hypothetical protein